jgi:hypothetical protein
LAYSYTQADKAATPRPKKNEKIASAKGIQKVADVCCQTFEQIEPAAGHYLWLKQEPQNVAVLILLRSPAAAAFIAMMCCQATGQRAPNLTAVRMSYYY